MFSNWMYEDNPRPYNSFGNGSGMRVSPVGWFFNTLEETLAEAERSAAVTHNHPEGVKGAQTIASAVFLGRTGGSKEEIKHYIETTFKYDLNRDCDDIRPNYYFNETCQGSVPEAIIAFLDSWDFESAIRLAVSLGGDSDTIAAMTGSIAEAFYGGVPQWIADEVIKRLPENFIEVINRFDKNLREGKSINHNFNERPKFTPDNIISLLPDEVFVFGSNLAGHHGGGAAWTALNKFGAIYGQGIGLQGQSYAIPTMQGGVETIVPYVDEFIDFAKKHPEKFFYVTRIGCGIAGFRDEEIAPLFKKALNLHNVSFPESFVDEMTKKLNQ